MKSLFLFLAWIALLAGMQAVFNEPYENNNGEVYWLLIGISILFLPLTMLFRKTGLFRWLASMSAFNLVSGCFLLLCLLIGIIPQQRQYTEADFCFFRNITDSYIWGVVYLMLLLSLETLIVRRLFEFKWRCLYFYFIHIGVWMIFFFAALNSLKSLDYIMELQKGQTEWRVYNERNRLMELPVAIRLDSIISDRESFKAHPATAFEITVYTRSGIEEAFCVKTNHPARAGHWSIYPYHAVGKYADKGIFILAYNPHWNGVLAGICLLAIGLVLMAYQKIRIK